jgi:hypothetical protein
MGRLTTFVAVVLMLSTAAPVMACVTGAAMTREEKACCRSMHGNCPEMAKMGCCQSKVKTDDHPQIAASIPDSVVRLVPVARLGPALNNVLQVISILPQAAEDPSPPGQQTAKTTILRI